MSSSVFANLRHVLHSRDPAVDKRRVARDLVDMASHATAHRRSLDVRIINISALGLMCRCGDRLVAGEQVHIWLPVVKDYPASIRWVEDDRAGMEFLQPITPTVYQAMLAVMPPRQTDW